MSEKTDHTTSANIEFLTKAAAFAVGAAYLCGFLVVSIYLSGYGVYSISLLRAQYLAAGILSLVPLWLTYVVVAMLYTSFEGFPFGPLPASGWARVRRIFGLAWRVVWEFLKIFAISSVIIEGLASVFVPSVRGLLWSHWRVFSWLTVQSVAFTVALTKTWRVATHFTGHELRQDMKKTFPTVLLSAFCVFSFLGYMNYFARHLYSEIPFTIGGGKPQSVAFLLKQGISGATAPVIPDKAGSRSIPYKLILETDTTYTVLSQITKERAIQFSRDVVQGYVVLDEP